MQALWLPALVLAGTAVLAALPGRAGPLVAQVPTYLAVGLALVGLLLGARFRQSRIVFALIVLALAYLAMSTAVTGRPGADAMGQVLYAGLALLLPLDLALIAVLEERGILTPHGLGRLGLLAGQAILLAWLAFSAAPAVQDAAAGLLHLRLLPPGFDRWSHLPQPALLAFALAVLALIGRLALRPGPVEAALLTAALAAGVGLHLVADATLPALYLTAAMAALTLAVVQESYRMAFLDELTGLSGRRALTAEMKALAGRYVVAMVDVDHFKQFNDTYGHEVGDQVLKLVAGCLARAPAAKAFRYGGEEFTLLYPGLDLDAAEPELEAVRLAVASSQFRRRGRDRPRRPPPGAPRRGGRGEGGLSVTVSIGVAQRGNGGERPEQVLEAADLALYGAKRAGRNRVMRYRPRRQKRRRPADAG